MCLHAATPHTSQEAERQLAAEKAQKADLNQRLKDAQQKQKSAAPAAAAASDGGNGGAVGAAAGLLLGGGAAAVAASQKKQSEEALEGKLGQEKKAVSELQQQAQQVRVACVRKGMGLERGACAAVPHPIKLMEQEEGGRSLQQ